MDHAPRQYRAAVRQALKARSAAYARRSAKATHLFTIIIPDAALLMFRCRAAFRLAVAIAACLKPVSGGGVVTGGRASAKLSRPPAAIAPARARTEAPRPPTQSPPKTTAPHLAAGPTPLARDLVRSRTSPTIVRTLERNRRPLERRGGALVSWCDTKDSRHMVGRYLGASSFSRHCSRRARTRRTNLSPRSKPSCGQTPRPRASRAPISTSP